MKGELRHRQERGSLTTACTYQSLSDGGGGRLSARVPTSPFSSTDSIIRVFDTPSMAFLMYFISVAWKRNSQHDMLGESVAAAIGNMHDICVLQLPMHDSTGAPRKVGMIMDGYQKLYKVLAVQKVLSGSGRATRRWPIYFSIRRSLPARSEPDNTFWTASTDRYWL